MKVVRLEIDPSHPKTRAVLERMSRSMTEWRERLEKGRRRMRVFVEEERIDRILNPEKYHK